MSPWAESVYPRYTSLCKATHWEGKTWPNADRFILGNVYTLLMTSIVLPEWCREGGCSHHGQGAPSGREICVWDFPTATAIHQVNPFCLLSVFHMNTMLIVWLITRMIINCLQFCCSSSDTLLSHVEQLLRAFILKISVCDAILNNNPPGNDTDGCLRRNNK